MQNGSEHTNMANLTSGLYIKSFLQALPPWISCLGYPDRRAKNPRGVQENKMMFSILLGKDS